MKTDAAGQFALSGLPAGDYVMEAQRPGFKAITLTITIGTAAVSRELALAIGAVRESLTIKIDPTPNPAPASPSTAPRPAPTPRPERPCAAGTTGGQIQPPLKLRDRKPVYPEHLKADKVAGDVVAEAVIGGDGRVRDIRIVKTPHADLGRALTEAIEGWAFQGTRLNCDPVDVQMTVTATFTY